MIAILGDIHANLPALQAVFDHCEGVGVDRYYSVGDVVGYFSMPAQCIELLRDHDTRVVQGNHDFFVANNGCADQVTRSAARAFDWTRQSLRSDDLDWLRQLPYTLLEDSAPAFRLVHASLSHPYAWSYVKTLNEAIRLLTVQDTFICFYGHTHLPMAFSCGPDFTGERLGRLRLEGSRKYLINVGSVGQPRDGDRRAQIVLFDPNRREVWLDRIDYDVRSVFRSQLAAGLPDAPLEHLR